MTPVKAARRLLALLAPEQRRRAFWLAPAMILMALMETIGVATIMPFLAMVASPGTALDNRYMAFAYDLFGFSSANGFLIFLGVLSLVVLVVSNGISVVVTYLLNRFAMRQNHLLQTSLMAAYLAQPYSSFLGANTAELGKNVLVEASTVIDKVLMPLLQLVARMVVSLSILILLLIVDPVLALAVSVAIGGSYALVFLMVRRKLSRLGEDRVNTDRVRFRNISEAFGGVKDVKVSGRENTFIDGFRQASIRYSNLTVEQRVINIVPKYGLEVIAFGGIVLIVLYLLTMGQSTATVLPIVGLYAFASYRLMPAVQQVFEALAQLRFSLPALDLLEKGLLGTVPTDLHFNQPEPLGLKDALSLDGVSFNYPGTELPSVRNVDLTIRRNQSVAFVGATGSGKTTIIDLILGLLSPTQGAVLIDGAPLDNHNLRAWQATVGYVPQQVFLSDTDVAGNIAFGVPPEKIDQASVERAAHIAQIHDFVAALPNGYSNHVGERGVRLSGGQRQRLGIARALYRDPPVVVLDEATSALDGVTERAVFDALQALAGKKTVVLIAHRIATVRDCDVINVIDDGRVVASGSYDELMTSSSAFRALVQARPRQMARDDTAPTEATASSA